MNYVRDTREFTSEFVINNLPNEQREYLLLKDVRRRISDFADVSIAVRGRVVLPRSDGTLICEGDEKPLYLLIAAKTKHQLTQAVEEIQRILTAMSPGNNGNNDNNGLSEDDSLEERITVGIDVWPAQFCMKSRLLGENGEFVDYIQNETGAIITLRGKGSDYGADNKYEEPLHVYIKYENPGMRERTRELVLNLIETVQRDFLDLYAKYYAQPKSAEILPVRKPGVRTPSNEKPALGKKIPDLPTRKDTDKIMIGFDYAPRNYDLKAKIYGPNYAHTEHIEKEGGALILLQGRGCRFPEKDDVDEPPHLLVKYQNIALKSKARELIFNLLESVQHDYVRLHGTSPIRPEKPRIVLYDPKSHETKTKSREQSTSSGRNLDYPRRSNTPPSMRYKHHPSSLRRSNTPPSFRGPNTPPTPGCMNSPPMSRRPDLPLVSSRHMNSPPPASRRQHSPPEVSGGPETPPSHRRTHSPSMLRRPNSPPIMRRLESPPMSRHPQSPPMSRRPNSPPMLRHPYSLPISRRPNSPPKASRQSTMHQHRSRSPVYAPPPPAISSSEPYNTYNSTPEQLPPIILPLKEPMETAQLPPSTFSFNNHRKPKRQAGNQESYQQYKTSEMELAEPVQNLKNPEFYMTQSKPPLQFAVPSLTTSSNFGPQKYVKKKEISPESSINNSFTENKKYFPSLPHQMDAKVDHKRNAEPGSPLANQMNNRVRHRSLVQISFKEEFAVPQQLSKVQNNPTNNTPIAHFNDYEYKNENPHQFTTLANTSVVSRKRQHTQMEKVYHVNDNNYHSSDSEDGASVICIDSEDDYYHPGENLTSSAEATRRQTQRPTSMALSNNKPMTFSVKVQTDNEDEVLKKKKIQCICGKFTHFLTGVRSQAVQTEPERYIRY